MGNLSGVRINGAPGARPFELTLAALQGCWRHSISSLGILTVQGQDVKSDVGSSFRIQAHPDGTLELEGWIASPDRSTAAEIVWTMDDESCSWHRELGT